MESNINELLNQITDFIQNEAQTKTVVGDSFTLGEFTCIPVIRVGMGLGTGGGEGDGKSNIHGEGIGVGAGMGIEPIGFLASHGDQLQFISTKTNKGLAAAFEKVPDLISSYLKTKETENVA